jgi:hypothetical protein
MALFAVEVVISNQDQDDCWTKSSNDLLRPFSTGSLSNGIGYSVNTIVLLLRIVTLPNGFVLIDTHPLINVDCYINF